MGTIFLPRRAVAERGFQLHRRELTGHASGVTGRSCQASRARASALNSRWLLTKACLSVNRSGRSTETERDSESRRPEPSTTSAIALARVLLRRGFFTGSFSGFYETDRHTSKRPGPRDRPPGVWHSGPAPAGFWTLGQSVPRSLFRGRTSGVRKQRSRLRPQPEISGHKSRNL